MHRQSEVGIGAGEVMCGPSPALIERFHEPDVELVIWERALPPGLDRWLNALPISRLPDGRVLVEEPHLPAALSQLLDMAGMPRDAMYGALLDDMIGLARLFMRTMASDIVDIRLESIQHDACWKFHRDCVAARLLTTYRGPGTQWVQPRDSAAALADQRSYEGRIEAFPSHAVGLFKGNRAPPASGIVHRSPPIAGTGVARLVLCHPGAGKHHAMKMAQRPPGPEGNAPIAARPARTPADRG